ncbi:MAG: hypothetical protein CMF41_05940 [Legionellales bacterium]|nr:hypothetical protein [Legionellales bacterium]OUX64253.1 MAG: hypothetical protein CBE41_03555 [Gammaproteobacteria bacterium TMED281]
MHRKVQVILYVETTMQWLILQVSPSRGGFWQNITGSVEHHESFLHAASRELFEETGIHIPSNLLIDICFTVYYDHPRLKQVQERCFLVKLSDVPELTLSEEHQDYKWINTSDLTRQPFAFESNLKATMQAIKFLD